MVAETKKQKKNHHNSTVTRQLIHSCQINNPIYIAFKICATVTTMLLNEVHFYLNLPNRENATIPIFLSTYFVLVTSLMYHVQYCFNSESWKG